MEKEWYLTLTRKKFVLFALLAGLGLLGAGALGGANLEEVPWLEAFCGTERWPVKTGSDADKKLVDLKNPMATTIATMTGWPYPASIPGNNRIAPYETTVWVINATLTQYKAEDDEDIHLILRDSANRTMIAEIPTPHCLSLSSVFKTGVNSAYAQFTARYSASDQFQTANIPVQIMGVGMFDFFHGQSGAAPNQIELHSVLDIVFNPASSATVAGAVTLEGCDPAHRAQPVTFTFRPADGSAAFVRSGTLDPNGNFSLDNIPVGNYALAVKSDKYLQKVTPLGVFSAGVSGLAITLTGGDGNNDNSVDNLDLGLLALAFGAATGDPGFVAQADLNNDGFVDNLDLGILANNYGLAGDD